MVSLNVLSSFYSSLFSSEDTIPSAQAVLLNNLETSLPPEQSGLCDGPLSLSACHSCLLGMALRKAPGCDGLPVEFYLKFWDVLGAGACFSKVPKLFGPISGDIILFVSSKRRRLEPRNFAVIFIFIPFTTCEKISFTE